MRGCRDLPDDLSHLDTARLVEQQHPPGARLLSLALSARLGADKVRGLGVLAACVGGSGEGVGARREQHLADLADFGRANGDGRERVIRRSGIQRAIKRGFEVCVRLAAQQRRKCRVGDTVMLSRGTSGTSLLA